MSPPRRPSYSLPEPADWRSLAVVPSEYDWRQLVEDINVRVNNLGYRFVRQTSCDTATFTFGRLSYWQGTHDVQVSHHVAYHTSDMSRC